MTRGPDGAPDAAGRGQLRGRCGPAGRAPGRCPHCPPSSPLGLGGETEPGQGRGRPHPVAGGLTPPLVSGDSERPAESEASLRDENWVWDKLTVQWGFGPRAEVYRSSPGAPTQRDSESPKKGSDPQPEGSRKPQTG